MLMLANGMTTQTSNNSTGMDGSSSKTGILSEQFNRLPAERKPDF